MRSAVYPGSFDPLTIAHVAIAETAIAELDLARVEFCLSVDPLGKPHLAATLDERVERIRSTISGRTDLCVVTSPHRLVADIAATYDVVVLGADKWEQVLDPSWYGDDPQRRNDAVARLPLVAVAGRTGSTPSTPPEAQVHWLSLPAHLADVSATAVRMGRTEWAAEPASEPDRHTGVEE